MSVMDGKSLSDLIATDLRAAADGKHITLAILLVGDDPASVKYVNAKQKRAAEIGIDCNVIHLDSAQPITPTPSVADATATPSRWEGEFRLGQVCAKIPFPSGRGADAVGGVGVTESEILEIIKKLNEDKTVNGIMVQLPLPRHITHPTESSIPLGTRGAHTVMHAIAPGKDVDGLNPASRFFPATVRGIEKLLEHYVYGPNFDLSGLTAVVVGQSDIVGRPAAKMALDHNATVIICHSRTKNLTQFTRMADLLISATGAVDLIKPGDIKEGVVLIDAGTIGDIDRGCYEKASAYTPVPGGVGPMTIISLLENVIRAAAEQSEK
ncbi:MAG: bifunctional 5,10-methylenetetrahydrofolate dehydrogenase/5,10-methenyltetrahydrofolate cyclohydrolase [Proteobacteria bacterium]|nr:bifunctional 5,10-methylenetetrahydrofolate dehydrogenase/5,10-methenyltetrahydrofolate cyclohydrolase [Pseudomonadota bacterium]